MGTGFRVIAGVIAAGVLSGCATDTGQTASSLTPDEVFYNGKIITVDPDFRILEAFAVKDGRFLAVGSSEDVRALADANTRLVDLSRHSVIPGLMDNHNHQFRAAGVVMRGEKAFDVRSLAELLERVRQAVANADEGQTVLVGGGWFPEGFPEKRGPTRQELDDVSGGRPVVVLLSRTVAYLNSAALKALGISRDTGSFAGNRVPKDASGEPTGQLTSATDQVNMLPGAVSPLFRPLTDDEKKQLILRMQAQQSTVGLTSIRELSLRPDIMRIYQDLRREDWLTSRVSMGLSGSISDPDEMEATLRSWGVGPGFGDHWLRLDAVAELGVDGIYEGALVRGSSADPRVTPENMRQTLAVIHKYGWRPSIHIFGDQALDHVLDAYEAVDKVSPIRERRWVVEHIPLVQPDQMERMARLGVVVSAQAQPYRYAERIVRAWGEERGPNAVPVRQMLDHQLVVSSGSDWPAYTNNPFINISFYVTRDTLAGPLGVSQQVSREEALRMVTVNNAYLTFEEDVKGSIEAGKLADFLILSEDILTVPEEEIRNVHPLATYVDGRKVFSREDSGF